MRRPTLPLAWTLLACLFVAPLAGAQGTAVVWTLLTAEGRRPLPVTSLDNRDYVQVDDLAGPFGTTAREAAGGLTLTAGGRTIILTADQTVVSAGGRLVSLPAPTRRRDGRWYVPVDFIPRALGAVLDEPIDLRRSSSHHPGRSAGAARGRPHRGGRVGRQRHLEIRRPRRPGVQRGGRLVVHPTPTRWTWRPPCRRSRFWRRWRW